MSSVVTSPSHFFWTNRLEGKRARADRGALAIHQVAANELRSHKGTPQYQGGIPSTTNPVVLVPGFSSKERNLSYEWMEWMSHRKWI